MIKAEIIADSISEQGHRITTFVMTYPRIIHAEVLTHRHFSRNGASSRAIPTPKMLEMVRNNPAMPEYYGINRPGMQALDQMTGPEREAAEAMWREMAGSLADWAEKLNGIGLHKQLANRVMETAGHITILLTSTEFHNFFGLRAHKDAQPEFQVLAYRALDRYLKSVPTLKQIGQWHIPFRDKMPDNCAVSDMLKIATARAARVSYLTFDGEMNFIKDYELHDNLKRSGHWSPFEHCARVQDPILETNADCGNFKGWIPYRKNFPEEAGTQVDLKAIMAAKPDWITL